MINKSIKLNINSEELDRLAIGARLYDAMKYSDDRVNFYSILKYDEETEEVLIKEDDLLELVKLVNKEQKILDKEPLYKRIRLVKSENKTPVPKRTTIYHNVREGITKEVNEY